MSEEKRAIRKSWEHTGRTPGEWASIYGGHYIVPAHHRHRPIGAAVDADEDFSRYAQVICEVRDDRYGRGERIGNALLLSAAPSLLEAAKEAVRTFPLNSEGRKARDMLHAAIEKAEDGHE